jgi:pyrroloquinoline quinone biosynthesis protein D
LITRESVPGWRRGIRRRFDATREAHVLLGPERVIVLDEIASAITELVDAKNSVARIAQLLAQRFSADEAEVTRDVAGFIEELLEKGLVTA